MNIFYFKVIQLACYQRNKPKKNNLCRKKTKLILSLADNIRFKNYFSTCENI